MLQHKYSNEFINVFKKNLNGIYLFVAAVVLPHNHLVDMFQNYERSKRMVMGIKKRDLNSGKTKLCFVMDWPLKKSDSWIALSSIAAFSKLF